MKQAETLHPHPASGSKEDFGAGRRAEKARFRKNHNVYYAGELYGVQAGREVWLWTTSVSSPGRRKSSSGS